MHPKEAIHSPQAPPAAGPYSQAIRAGNFLFLAGQIPLVGESGTFAGTDIQSQTRQVLENLKAVLGAAKLDFSHVVKTTVFLADMNDFAAMNEIYGSYFVTPFPARSTIQVARLPRDAKIEIEAVAITA